MYDIRIKYRTGNSFDSEDCIGALNGSWNIETAKENLKRIKAHYEAHQNRNNYYSLGSHKKAEEHFEELKKEPWFPANNNELYRAWEFKIRLKENDGSSKEYHVFWTGYFETLYGGEIVSVKDDDMSFEV